MSHIELIFLYLVFYHLFLEWSFLSFTTYSATSSSFFFAFYACVSAWIFHTFLGKEICFCSIEETIIVLKKKNVCCVCLCLGVRTLSHPDKSFNYLSAKDLLFLHCKFRGCRLRSSFCDIHHGYPSRSRCLPDTSFSVSAVSNNHSTDTGMSPTDGPRKVWRE